MDTTTEIIKRLRAAGFSQSEIARQTKNSQSAISRWEAGNAPFGADAALRLAEFAKRALRKKPTRSAATQACHQ